MNVFLVGKGCRTTTGLNVLSVSKESLGWCLPLLAVHGPAVTNIGLRSHCFSLLCRICSVLICVHMTHNVDISALHYAGLVLLFKWTWVESGGFIKGFSTHAFAPRFALVMCHASIFLKSCTSGHMASNQPMPDKYSLISQVFDQYTNLSSIKKKRLKMGDLLRQMSP